MLKISKSYIVREDGVSCLCADLTIENRKTTMWFGVPRAHEDWLAIGRADPFLMAMLPGAMRGAHEILCEDPMSERLHYQLRTELIPALSFAGDLYHNIKIFSPLTPNGISNQGAVGTGYSGGVDSLYTIYCRNENSELPITHLAVFNTGSRRRKSSTLQKIFRRAQEAAAELNLTAIYVDTNFKDILRDSRRSSYTYRNLACILAMQGLFKSYLLSSGPNASKMSLDLDFCDHYDILTVNCASTESLALYLFGVERTRREKLTALSDWEPSRRWLNACTRNEGELINCSRCKKCIHDMTMLYALGKLDQYRAIFDLEDYYKNLPARIGYVLANSDYSESCSQTAALLRERNASIPSSAYAYEKTFRDVLKIHEKIRKSNERKRKKEKNENDK